MTKQQYALTVFGENVRAFPLPALSLGERGNYPPTRTARVRKLAILKFGASLELGGWCLEL